MAAYLRCNLLLAAASPPRLEARVGGVELNHATRLLRGARSEWTFAHPFAQLKCGLQSQC